MMHKKVRGPLQGKLQRAFLCAERTVLKFMAKFVKRLSSCHAVDA